MTYQPCLETSHLTCLVKGQRKDPKKKKPALVGKPRPVISRASYGASYGGGLTNQSRRGTTAQRLDSRTNLYLPFANKINALSAHQPASSRRIVTSTSDSLQVYRLDLNRSNSPSSNSKFSPQSSQTNATNYQQAQFSVDRTHMNTANQSGNGRSNGQTIANGNEGASGGVAFLRHGDDDWNKVNTKNYMRDTNTPNTNGRSNDYTNQPPVRANGRSIRARGKVYSRHSLS